MPFILCATICCCLPCIIALLGFREEDRQGRGASEEAISALPTYKFKSKGACQDGKTKEENDSDTEAAGEGGIVGFGTDHERVVSAEDAVRCHLSLQTMKFSRICRISTFYVPEYELTRVIDLCICCSCAASALGSTSTTWN